MAHSSVEELREALRSSQEFELLRRGHGISREEVFAAFKEILRRPPESETTIATRMTHSSVEELREALRSSAEFELLRTPYPGERIAIGDVPAEIARHLNGDMFKTLAGMNSFWVDIPECSHSPDSPEYRDWVLETYSRLASRDYATKEEIADFVAGELVAKPFPYATENAKTVGDQLMAIGYVIQAMNLPAGSSVFEMGFGWGNTVLQMARMGYRVSGLDVNERYIDLVNSQADMLGVKVDVKQGEFFDLERMEEKFDAILFFEAFHHCDDHVRLLKAIPDRLNEGGKLVLAGEAVNNALPYPWGVNPGGQAIYCVQEYG